MTLGHGDLGGANSEACSAGGLPNSVRFFTIHV
jgi:hypothetical protein